MPDACEDQRSFLKSPRHWRVSCQSRSAGSAKHSVKTRRELPTTLLRIGWLDDGDGIGLQSGCVTVRLGGWAEGAGVLG